MKVITFLLIIIFSMPMHSQYKYITYDNRDISESEMYKRGNKYQKDFLLFLDMLHSTHPIFSKKQELPINISNINIEGYKTLDSCTNNDDFVFLLQNIIAPLRDGHTFINYMFDSDLEYPIKLSRYANEYYIISADEKYSSIIGKKIAFINKKKVSQIIESFQNFLVSDNYNKLIINSLYFMQNPRIWKYSQLIEKDNNPLSIELENGEEIIVKAEDKNTVRYIELPNGTNKTITNNQDVPFFYKIEKDICYFQFNSCVDYYTILAMIEMESASEADKKLKMEQYNISSYGKFSDFLLEMFNNIKLNNIETLVIDLRHNGGGNNLLCYQLLSYLFPIDSLRIGESFIRPSKLMRKQYPEVYNNIKLVLSKDGKEFKEGKLYDEKTVINEDSMKKYFQYNESSQLIFKKKIFFLQGRKTYSSAGDLLILARDNKIGCIIGEESTFRPCNFGDMLLWKLPNTGIQGGISHKYFVRPNKSLCNEYILIPDVLISQTIDNYKEGIDPFWIWILANSRK